MQAQTAQIISLSEFRQERAAARARQENTSDSFALPTIPFFFFMWTPVMVFPLSPQAPGVAQNDG